MSNLSPIWSEYRKILPGANFYTVDKYGQQTIHQMPPVYNNMSGTWTSPVYIALGLKNVKSSVEIDPNTGIPKSTTTEFNPLTSLIFAEDLPEHVLELAKTMGVKLIKREEPQMVAPDKPLQATKAEEAVIGVQPVVKPQEFEITEVKAGVAAKPKVAVSADGPVGVITVEEKPKVETVTVNKAELQSLLTSIKIVVSSLESKLRD